MGSGYRLLDFSTRNEAESSHHDVQTWVDQIEKILKNLSEIRINLALSLVTFGPVLPVSICPRV